MLLKTTAGEHQLHRSMLRLFDSKIESNLRAGSRVAIVHGCIEMHAAQ
jgi:hypothetical protein